MVEMLLEKIEEHADMGGTMDILELMAGELGHDNRLVVELVGDVEKGYAHIAGHKGVGRMLAHDGGDEIGRGTLALGTGYAYGLLAVDLEEDIGLGGYGVEIAQALEDEGGDAWRLDDEIVSERGLLTDGIITLDNGNIGLGQQGTDETFATLAFAAVTCQEDTLALEDTL